MDGIITALVAALCIGIVTLIVAIIARFLGRFNEETRRIADNLRRAQDSDEYIYWQSRLRRHYIRLLPFVSEKTAGRICSRLFRKPKHCQEKEQSDGLFHILAPSVLSVCLCAICLCGMSWAWFTATGNTSVSTIQAASYEVTVTVTPNGSDENSTYEVSEVDRDTTVTFKKNGTYKVTLTATGKASKGYFLVEMTERKEKVDEVNAETEKTCVVSGVVGKNECVAFKVNAGVSDSLTVEPLWLAQGCEDLPSSVANSRLNVESAYTLAGYVEPSNNETDEADETNEEGGSTGGTTTTNATNVNDTSKEDEEKTANFNANDLQFAGDNKNEKEDTSAGENGSKKEETNGGDVKTEKSTAESGSTTGSDGSEGSTVAEGNGTVETNDAENG